MNITISKTLFVSVGAAFAVAVIAVILYVIFSRRRKVRMKTSRVNLVKIGWCLLAVSGISAAVFTVCVIALGSAESTVLWRVFSVCMPVTGICFTCAAVLSLIDYLGKR